MRNSARHHSAASFAILTIAALAGTGCSEARRLPTVAQQPAVMRPSPTPSAKGVALQQQVAARRSHRLSGSEVARVKFLKGKWQWVADLHHAAMQEAIHDPSLRGLRQQHTPAERCATAVRYLTKHYPAIEAHSGKHTSRADQAVAISKLASQIGVCPPAENQANIFATPTPSTAARGSVPRILSAVQTDAGPINTQQIAVTWGDYVIAMSADVRQAKDLGDATEIMDTYLATAAADPAVSEASLALIAGTIDLAASSANEWDSFARPREGSIFMWGWLSDLGNWVADVVMGDLNGCVDAVGIEFLAMAQFGWTGSLADFGSVTAQFCVGGAIIGSIWSAI